MRRTPSSHGRTARAGGTGFTLIELSVVLAIIALLLLLVTPRYFGALDRSKEQVLSHNMLQIRAAIDQYHADRGRYPESVRELVELRYLRSMPVNPVTESTEWDTVLPPPGEAGRVFDVRRPEAPVSDAKPASAAQD
ncbi:Prepilin-type N-terminal cleavage/methylation domain-containing protein [Rubrivivax sp. A210]|uniref:type II secretion system protein n=1 Tax=Rubrivivax sp. A210 TaxID=2772301 RepID=UPI0019191B83|nr:prepilin-type N-terminal cleavage/methylation domain-containing protein [Rubrivivax sp. A210]CAD5374004.1 Prepilin-type N-terminal cleavage/methylation domain-containing protein [Rubrivivax sp. A210]